MLRSSSVAMDAISFISNEVASGRPVIKVLLGDPGSGKTTFLQLLQHKIASDPGVVLVDIVVPHARNFSIRNVTAGLLINERFISLVDSASQRVRDNVGEMDKFVANFSGCSCYFIFNRLIGGSYSAGEMSVAIAEWMHGGRKRMLMDQIGKGIIPDCPESSDYVKSLNEWLSFYLYFGIKPIWVIDEFEAACNFSYGPSGKDAILAWLRDFYDIVAQSRHKDTNSAASLLILTTEAGMELIDSYRALSTRFKSSSHFSFVNQVWPMKSFSEWPPGLMRNLLLDMYVDGAHGDPIHSGRVVARYQGEADGVVEKYLDLILSSGNEPRMRLKSAVTDVFDLMAIEHIWVVRKKEIEDSLNLHLRPKVLVDPVDSITEPKVNDVAGDPEAKRVPAEDSNSLWDSSHEELADLPGSCVSSFADEPPVDFALSPYVCELLSVHPATSCREESLDDVRLGKFPLRYAFPSNKAVAVDDILKSETVEMLARRYATFLDERPSVAIPAAGMAMIQQKIEGFTSIRMDVNVCFSNLAQILCSANMAVPVIVAVDKNSSWKGGEWLIQVTKTQELGCDPLAFLSSGAEIEVPRQEDGDVRAFVIPFYSISEMRKFAYQYAFQAGVMPGAVEMDRFVLRRFEAINGRQPVIARSDGVRFEATPSGILESLFGGARKFSREPVPHYSGFVPLSSRSELGISYDAYMSLLKKADAVHWDVENMNMGHRFFIDRKELEAVRTSPQEMV